MHIHQPTMAILLRKQRSIIHEFNGQWVTLEPKTALKSFFRYWRLGERPLLRDDGA